MQGILVFGPQGYAKGSYIIILSVGLSVCMSALLYKNRGDSLLVSSVFFTGRQSTTRVQK